MKKVRKERSVEIRLARTEEENISDRNTAQEKSDSPYVRNSRKRANVEVSWNTPPKMRIPADTAEISTICSEYVMNHDSQ